MWEIRRFLRKNLPPGVVPCSQVQLGNAHQEAPGSYRFREAGASRSGLQSGNFVTRTIGFGLLTAMVAIALVACHSEQTAIAPITDSAQAKEPPITLRFSGWQSNPNEKKLLEQLIKEFETQNPSIDVKYEVINSEYMDVIKTRLIGDVAPDVFYLDVFEAPLLMKYGVLEPLDSYMTPEFNLADFEPSLLNAFKYNGKLYGLPKDFSTLALFYNTDSFAAAGLTQPPKTWDEFLTASKVLTIDQNKDGKIDQYGFGVAPELARQVFMIKAFGGELLDSNGYAVFASPNSLKGLELVIDQYRTRSLCRSTL